MWLLVSIFGFNFEHSEDKKIFSDGSHPYPCPPELEAHKNLLVHEWKPSSAQQRHVDTLSCFTLDSENGKFVINMVSHRPEPTRQPYTIQKAEEMSRLLQELDCQELVPCCCCCTDIHHKRRGNKKRNKTWYVVAIMQSHIFESFETTMRCFGKSNWASQLFRAFSYGLRAVRVKQLMLYTCWPFKLQSWKFQIWGIRGTNIRNEHSMIHEIPWQIQCVDGYSYRTPPWVSTPSRKSPLRRSPSKIACTERLEFCRFLLIISITCPYCQIYPPKYIFTQHSLSFPWDYQSSWECCRSTFKVGILGI